MRSDCLHGNRTSLCFLCGCIKKKGPASMILQLHCSCMAVLYNRIVILSSTFFKRNKSFIIRAYADNGYHSAHRKTGDIYSPLFCYANFCSNLNPDTSYVVFCRDSPEDIRFSYSRLCILPDMLICEPICKSAALRAFVPQNIIGM